MTDNNSVLKIKETSIDSKIINTINHPEIYPNFEMLTNSDKGINRFEMICLKYLFLHLLIVVVALFMLSKVIDIFGNNNLNFYLLSFCSLSYILGGILNNLNNKKKIVVKTIFRKIEKLGEKGTLVYFLATLRNSSFITKRKEFTEMLDDNDYDKIFKELQRVFEIISKENLVYRPTTPTKNLIPL